MREFMGYEYVDGDITIYVREEGEDDSKWTKAGVVKWGEVRAPGLVMRKLGLTGPGGELDVELNRLGQELSWPRRH
jgi:hypothetical protein